MSTTPVTPTASDAPKYPDQVTGMYILAKSLKNIGIDTMYGLLFSALNGREEFYC